MRLPPSPLTAATSAPWAHFSLIYLPCSQLLFLSSTCFAPSCCRHMFVSFCDCFYIHVAKCSRVQPTHQSLCMDLGVRMFNRIMSCFWWHHMFIQFRHIPSRSKLSFHVAAMEYQTRSIKQHLMAVVSCWKSRALEQRAAVLMCEYGCHNYGLL